MIYTIPLQRGGYPDFYKSNKDPTADLLNIAGQQVQSYTLSILGESHETRK